MFAAGYDGGFLKTVIDDFMKVPIDDFKNEIQSQFPQRGNFVRFGASLTSPHGRCAMSVLPFIRFSPPHHWNSLKRNMIPVITVLVIFIKVMKNL
jgi:hypothetical protein